MSRSFLKIGQRIAAGYLALLLLILAVGGIGLRSTEAVVDRAIELYEHPFAVSNNLLDLRANLLRMDGLLTTALAFPDTAHTPGWQQELDRQELEGESHLDIAAERYLGSKGDSQALKSAWTGWRGAIDPMVAMLSRKEIVAARELYQTQVRPQFDRTLAAQEAMLVFARNRARQNAEASFSLQGGERRNSVLLLLLALGLAGSVTWLIVRSILFPLSRLRSSLAGIADGEKNVPEEMLDRADEIGDIARQIEALRRMVTLRKRTELKYQTLFRNCPDLIIVSHRVTSSVLEVNDAFERLLGFHRDEVIGFKALDLGIWVTPNDRAQMIKTVGEQGRLSGYEIPLRHKSGHILTMMLSLELIALDGQDALLVMGRDVSERKREEETLRRLVDELAKSNTELARFAHIAAHDLQEPSRSICSYAQLLERKHGAAMDDEGREFLAFMVAGAYRMRELVSGLLTYSRAGSRASSFRNVDLETLWSLVEIELNDSIVDRQAVIERQGSLPMIFGDSAQLQQLFTHLLGNALKFHQTGVPPHIRLAISGDGDWWHLTLQDNGIGIAPEYQEQVFEMFRRLHGQGRYPGSGLGLALARRIVEAHGGRIWLDSMPGVGTTVHATLPAERAATADGE